MSCPYLAEIAMSFCQAARVKKLVPTERIGAPSPCQGAGWSCCPVFRDAVREGKRAGVAMPSNAASKGGEP